MRILIDNGHGEETPGKRSPDGKFREYKYTREIASEIEGRLKNSGYDAIRLVPENEDISLKERCRRVNSECNKFGKDNIMLISIHVNAAGDASKWMNATGWQAHTSRGYTKSDELCECLYDAAEANFKGKRIRKDMSDGDRDYENGFYILRKTLCPAVLTENFFQDNKDDVAYLESTEGREAVINTHIEGIIKYLNQQ